MWRLEFFRNNQFNMAFAGRFGSLIKQSMSNNMGLKAQPSVSSMFNAIRSMSDAASQKLFVGGLSWSTDDVSLKEAFSSFGQVIDAKVIMDRESGRSRGFGFVSFDTVESAGAAISSMDGQELQGRNIRVNYATERAPRTGGYSGGGSYSSGGGYGGGNDQY